MLSNVILGLTVALLSIIGVALFLASLLYFVALAMDTLVKLVMLNGGKMLNTYRKSSFKEEIKYVWLKFTSSK